MTTEHVPTSKLVLKIEDDSHQCGLQPVRPHRGPETEAQSGIYNPVGHKLKGLGTTPPAEQEIATIFARHGDRLTVTTSGSSGQVELTVDGDGPDFSSITPDDNTVSRPSRLTFSFEVRDDDSGLRHDAEPITSRDGDPEEINPDGDQHLGSEPLSMNPQDNGHDERFRPGHRRQRQAEHRGGTDATDYADISASGTWASASTNAGVAYSFTASGAGRGEGEWLYELRARDRAGNETVTDATDDSGDPAVRVPHRRHGAGPDQRADRHLLRHGEGHGEG